MALGYTSRLALPTWSAGNDAFTRAQMTAAHQNIDSKVGGDLQFATYNDIPPASATLLGFYATVLDTGAVYRCDGAQWRPVSLSSVQLADAPPGTESFGVAGSAGTSGKLARADHRHAMPAHDAAAHSGIRLDQLAAPTAGVGFSGQRAANVADPTQATDAATKAYVDSKYNAAAVWSPMTEATKETLTVSTSAANGMWTGSAQYNGGAHPPYAFGTVQSSSFYRWPLGQGGWYFNLNVPMGTYVNYVYFTYPTDMNLQIPGINESWPGGFNGPAVFPSGSPGSMPFSKYDIRPDNNYSSWGNDVSHDPATGRAAICFFWDWGPSPQPRAFSAFSIWGIATRRV